MRAMADRLRVLLPSLWTGLLLAVVLVATPAPFVALAPADAGRVVARVLASEARLSLALAVMLFLLERRHARRRAAAGVGTLFSLEMGLVLGALFCTVLGHYALQPMVAAARTGQGDLSFGALHGLSVALFGLKGLLVLVLAWRNAAPAASVR